MINKWDRRFMRIAREYSKNSKDPSTGVGAVISNCNNIQVSQGFNGYPRGIADDETLHEREIKYLKVLHAEENSILFAKRDLIGHTMYVYGLFPCAHCMAMMVQSGIHRVVYFQKSDGLATERWKLQNDVARDMAKQVNMIIETITEEEIDAA
jgi:dCMP deaminase